MNENPEENFSRAVINNKMYEQWRGKASDLFVLVRGLRHEIPRKNFMNFSLDFRKGCSKLAVASKTTSLLLEGMGKIKEPTPSNWELSSARVLHAPVTAR
jgi:hypothetical protein